MATPSKTGGINMMTHALATWPVTLQGIERDVSTAFAAMFLLWHATVEAAVNTNPGSFLIQVSGKASGDLDWVTRIEIPTKVGAATNSREGMDNAEGVGDTVFEVTATAAAFVEKNTIYVEDVGVVAQGEWHILQEVVAATSLTVNDGLTTAKGTDDFINSNAEAFEVTIDLANVIRIRVLFFHEGAAAADSHVKVEMVELASIS